MSQEEQTKKGGGMKTASHMHGCFASLSLSYLSCLGYHLFVNGKTKNLKLVFSTSAIYTNMAGVT
jgi:hypothetical protein